MSKLLIICGPTATGKTSLALHLAKRFSGELLSADSRQVYRGLDIGTGKDLPVGSKFLPAGEAGKIKNSKLKIKDEYYIYGYYLVRGVKLWLLDLALPDQNFSVAHYYDVAVKTLQNVWQRGNLPIVVGGTGLYIKALISPLETIQIPPNPILRKKLSTKTLKQLTGILKKTDPQKLKNMNQSDCQNKRRLIRAIEIADYLKVDKKIQVPKDKKKTDFIIIGLTASRRYLYQQIDNRVDKRVHQGVIEETKRLLIKGYDWSLPSFSALGYREWKFYLEKKKGKEEVIKRWKCDEHDYARRQLTWFKKIKDINWFDISKPNFPKQAEELVEKWYTNGNF